MDTTTSNVQMKLLETVSSKFNANIIVIYYIFILVSIIMFLSSLGFIYIMFLDEMPLIPILISLSIFIFFAKLTFDGVRALFSMSRFILTIKIYEEGLDILVVPKRQLAFKNDKITTVNIIQKRSHFFKKILHDSSIFLEIIINKEKFLMALNNEDAEILKRFSHNPNQGVSIT